MRNTTRPIRIKLQGHTRFLLASMLLVGSGILTASPAAAPAFQGDTEQRDILLRSARNAVSLGDHGRALDRFEELVSRYPDDSEGRREYAGILVLAGKHEAGAQQFLHLLDGDPDNRKLRESLVDAYVLSGDYDRAASNMEHVLERAPDDAPVAARLARLYAWTKNFDRAMEIYRVHLSRLNPTSEDVQRLLAPVLLDTQRPLEALDFLTRLHRRHPNDIEVSADLVKCYTMLGDHVKAADVVDEIEGRDADRIDIRLSLGSYLHNVGSYQASRRIYDQVLSVDSRNREALLGMAQVRLASYELTQALAILQGLGNTSDDRLWKLVMAEYHVIVGEYPDGRALYGDLLAKDEDDFEVRIALGELYQVAGEYDYAMAEYRKVDERSAFGSEARYRHAVALSSLHRFDEANAICRSLLAQDAGYVQPLLLLLTNLGKSGAAEQARMISAEFLKQNRVDTHTVASIREALGRVLLEGGLYSEAAQQYELVVALPAGRTPTAYYGLSLAYRNLDILPKAEMALSSALSVLGNDFRNRIVLADMAAAGGDTETAIDMYDRILAWGADNVAALVRLADSKANAPSINFKREAADLYHRVLVKSAGNIRARLGLARTHAAQRRYGEAIAVYDQVLNYDATSTVAMLERARVFFWDHRYEEAHEAYALLEMQSAIDVLPINLQGDTLGGAPKYSQMDVDAKVAVQRRSQLEREAKDFKDWRDYRAMPKYRQLLSLDPPNQEGRFDLAQVYSQQNQTDDAIEQYEKLLAINPDHREAAVALERNLLELNPRVESALTTYSQEGRSDDANVDGVETFTLAEIDVAGVHTDAILPIGDENEFISLGFTHNIYDSTGLERDVNSDVIRGRVQKKPSERLLLFGQLNMEQFDSDIDNLMSFDTGFTYSGEESTRVDGRVFLERVQENGEALRQGIHRMGTKLGVNVKPGRRWDFGGNYQFADYSDDNTMQEFNLYNSLAVTYPPRELKVVLKYDYQDFSATSNYDDAIGMSNGTLEGVVHPYFSPSGYATYSASVEWRHYLSDDIFKGADVAWYSIQYSTSWDSDPENFNYLRVVGHYDVQNDISIGLDTQVMRSGVHDTTGARMYLTYRF